MNILKAVADVPSRQVGQKDALLVARWPTSQMDLQVATMLRGESDGRTNRKWEVESQLLGYALGRRPFPWLALVDSPQRLSDGQAH